MRIFQATLLAVPVLFAVGSASAEPKPNDTAICKAAIGALFGRDPAIIKAQSPKDGVITLSYVRPSDNTTWTNRCKVDGDRVLWASDTGRWRDSVHDEKISYKVEDAKLIIVQTYADGSKNTDSYPLDKL